MRMNVTYNLKYFALIPHPHTPQHKPWQCQSSWHDLQVISWLCPASFCQSNLFHRYHPLVSGTSSTSNSIPGRKDVKRNTQIVFKSIHFLSRGVFEQTLEDIHKNWNVKSNWMKHVLPWVPSIFQNDELEEKDKIRTSGQKLGRFQYDNTKHFYSANHNCQVSTHVDNNNEIKFKML